MATLLPSRLEALIQTDLDAESLALAIRPWRRRLITQQFVHWTVRGLIVGLFLAGLLLVVSRLTPWAGALYWAIGAGVACVVFAFAAALWYRPSIVGTARSIDKRLALHNRVETAWELREETSTLARLQRRDALQQLQKHAPTTALPLRLSRAGLLTFAILAIALTLLIVLPNPMTTILQQQAAFRAQMARQAAAVEKLRQELEHQTAVPAAQQEQENQILKDLENKLQQAQSTSDAQQALAQAQSKLDQLHNPQTQNEVQAKSAAGSALQNSGNSTLSSVGQALSKGDSQNLANALQKLNNDINKMSAAQRSQLAQQLEAAASQASQDPNLSSALHQLAKSIADGNQSEVTDATKAVQKAADQSTADQAKDNSISSTSQGLQQVANSLAASTDGSKDMGQSQSQQQGQAQSGQSQQGQGQGQQSQQGQQGQGQGQGQGQQQGQGQGQGNGGTGGTGSKGTNNGKDEQVYVPGQVGTGNSTSSKDNNNGTVQSGNAVPYSQVIQQYNQAAHDAIDSSNVSPDTKDLVHNYFDTLEGQK